MKSGSIICCIDDGGWSRWALREFTSLPTKDGLYVVRRVIPNWVDPNGPPGITAEEIFGSWTLFKTHSGQTIFEEYHFRKNRFQEVQPPQHFNDFFVESFLTELRVNH
jgi:hypothetical protein